MSEVQVNETIVEAAPEVVDVIEDVIHKFNQDSELPLRKIRDAKEGARLIALDFGALIGAIEAGSAVEIHDKLLGVISTALRLGADVTLPAADAAIEKSMAALLPEQFKGGSAAPRPQQQHPQSSVVAMVMNPDGTVTEFKSIEEALAAVFGVPEKYQH